MNKDSVLKLLRIISLTLIIFSLVFSIARFISHCEEPSLGASSGGPSNDPYYFFATPLPVKPEIGCSKPLTNEIISALVNRIQSGPYPTGYPYHEHGFDDVNLILFREYHPRNNTIDVNVFYDGYISSFDFPSDFSSDSTLCTFRSLNNYCLRITYDITNDSITYVTSANGNFNLPFYSLGSSNCYIYTAFSDPILNIDLYGIKTNFDIFLYPIYLRDGDLSFSGDVKFSTTVGTGSGDDDTNDEINDNIEDTSDLPQIDDNAPNDGTSIPAWLQKILSGLKVFNKNMLGIGKTIISGIKSVISKLTEIIETIAEWCVKFWDTLKDIWDSLEGLKDGTTQQDAVEEWKRQFNASYFGQLCTLIQSLIAGWGNAFNADAPSTLVFTIPMMPIGIPDADSGTVSNTYLFGNSITLNFSWYTQTVYFGKTIKTMVNDVFFVFVYASFCFAMLVNAPGFISGVPGSVSGLGQKLSRDFSDDGNKKGVNK